MKLITIAILAIVLGLFPAQATDISAGSFMRGDSNDGGGYKDEDPTNQVYVKEFAMDLNLVTLAQWKTVYQWAITNGYAFRYTGTAVTIGCPVQSINWYDAVKWCNARSQWSKLQPCYYTDTNLSAVYKQGEIKLAASNVNWTNSGYRLPTEAEWEKAARGGLNGQRFPWGNTIDHNQALYTSPGSLALYDLGPKNTYSAHEGQVGVYRANAYGLYDMAGNTKEWCWDWYATNYYSSGLSYTNPTGPTYGTMRVLRGGSWSDVASALRCANRSQSIPTSAGGGLIGFRCVISQAMNNTAVSN
jgi:formylglycine-generating enzyme required for sulfatase activity